jgi:predicted permease
MTRLWSQVRLPYPMPVAYDLTPDVRVFVFTVGLTLFTGLAFGLVPAIRATRIDLSPAMKEGGDLRFRRHRRLGLRNLMMTNQVAGSLALLMLTAFLVIGFNRSAGLDIRFDPRNLYLISMDPMREGYSGTRAAAFFEKLLDRVRGIPSVTAANLTDTVPVAMNGNQWTSFYTSGKDSREAKVLRHALKCVVGPGYFETLGLPIVAGRGFRKQDETLEAPGVIVSEKAAMEFWNGEDPLGRQIDLGSYLPGASMALWFNVNWGFDHRAGGRRVFEVVGVARDAKIDPVMGGMPAVVYFPLRPADYGRPFLSGVTLMVRSAPGADIAGAVRREVRAMDANLTPFNARSMAEQVGQFTILFRVIYWIYGALGAFGLVLASVGLAGVTAYSVTRRRREIGIRVALGASHANVLGLVMREGITLVFVGTVIGYGLALAGARVLGATAFVAAKSLEESISELAVLVGAPVLLAALAMAACYVPARRALRVNPVQALRQE